MTWIRQWWQRRQDRQIVRARLDKLAQQRASIEAEAARRALEMRLFRLMRSAA